MTPLQDVCEPVLEDSMEEIIDPWWAKERLHVPVTGPQNSLAVPILNGCDCKCTMHRMIEVESQRLEDLLRKDIEQLLTHIGSLGLLDVH